MPASADHPTPAAGLDEAGRGCLAGPVVAAAVILTREIHLPELADSKQLTHRQRETLEAEIKAGALCWSLGLAWPREIERVNVLQATLQAMCRALSHLRTLPAYVLVDGNQPLPGDWPHRSIVGGDSLVPEISAASVLAKTFRDRLMVRLDKRYPGYGFARNKGYGTREHLDRLRCLGVCPMHRRTYRPVRDLLRTEEQGWLPHI